MASQFSEYDPNPPGMDEVFEAYQMKYEIEPGITVDSDTGRCIGKRGRSVGYHAGGGYVIVCLQSYGRKRRREYLHRLIFAAVHGPIPAGMDINHINGIKDDNRIENLELATRSQNVKHAYENGLHPGRKVLDAEQVRQIAETRDSVTGNEWARRLGVSPSTVSLARRGLYGVEQDAI